MALGRRLEVVEGRLARSAAADPPTGLTEPDPGGEERWEAGQVWSHIAEFVPYWTKEVRRIVAAGPGQGTPAQPVPFGRIKSDAGRIAGIERERHTSPADLMASVHSALAEVRALAAELDGDAGARVGVHQTAGVFTGPEILDRFIASHLEEHADQLERLAHP